MTRRGLLKTLAAVGAAALLPFRSRAAEPLPTARLTASQKPIKCGFCGKAIAFRGPEDGMVMNARTQDRFVHRFVHLHCYIARFGTDDQFS